MSQSVGVATGNLLLFISGCCLQRIPNSARNENCGVASDTPLLVEPFLKQKLEEALFLILQNSSDSGGTHLGLLYDGLQ